MSSDTKQRLLDGAIAAIRTHGIAAVSARTIAAAAGVNQALVFYHFGSVDALLSAACTASTAVRVQRYADRLTEVGSLRELLDAGRALHTEERRLVPAPGVGDGPPGGHVRGPHAAPGPGRAALAQRGVRHSRSGGRAAPRRRS